MYIHCPYVFVNRLYIMSGLGLGFKCIYSCKSLTCILVNSHVSIRIIPKVPVQRFQYKLTNRVTAKIFKYCLNCICNQTG